MFPPCIAGLYSNYLQFRRDIYEPLNRTSPQIVRVTAASVLAEEFILVLPAKLRIVQVRSIRVYQQFSNKRYSTFIDKSLMKIPTQGGCLSADAQINQRR